MQVLSTQGERTNDIARSVQNGDTDILVLWHPDMVWEQKNAISHRARALQDFCRKYQEVQNHDK